MTREEYHRYEQHVKAHCVIGTDYHVTNEHIVHADGRTSNSGEIFGYYIITWQYFERSCLSLM
jgi:hypothetical protein